VLNRGLAQQDDTHWGFAMGGGKHAGRGNSLSLHNSVLENTAPSLSEKGGRKRRQRPPGTPYHPFVKRVRKTEALGGRSQRLYMGNV